MAFDSNQMVYIAIYIIYIYFIISFSRFNFVEVSKKILKEEKGERDELVYLDFLFKKKIEQFSNIDIF